MAKRTTTHRTGGRRAGGSKTSIGATVGGLLLIGLLLVLNACGVLPLEDILKELEGLEESPTATPTEGDLAVYFTDPLYPDKPEERPTDGMDARLAAAIDGAQKSVEVASFEFNLERVAEALLRAKERGVRVRMVTDTDYEDEVPLQDLMDANVPVVFDDREAFMHDKFVVIDGRQVWTGSWNLMDNDTFRNNNNVVVVNSTELAENYQREFEEMFKGQFGPRSQADTPNPVIEVDGIRIENYFSPEDGVREHIVDILEGAETDIYFMAFSFTDNEIGDAMIAKARAGVSVRGVMEARNVEGSGSEYARLRRAKVDLLADGNPYVLHHKVIIVDESIVIMGSYNFTQNAEESNDENVLIIYSPEVADKYLQEFNRIYQRAEEAK